MARGPSGGDDQYLFERERASGHGAPQASPPTARALSRRRVPLGEPELLLGRRDDRERDRERERLDAVEPVRWDVQQVAGLEHDLVRLGLVGEAAERRAVAAVVERPRPVVVGLAEPRARVLDVERHHALAPRLVRRGEDVQRVVLRRRPQEHALAPRELRVQVVVLVVLVLL